MINLELFKKHCNADDIGGVDDGLMQHYIDAANAYVLESTRRSNEELCEIGSGEWPIMLQQAAMMLAAHFYATREAVSIGATPAAVPYSIDALIKPYVRLTAGGDKQ